MDESLPGCSKDSPQYWPESPFPEEEDEEREVLPQMCTGALGEDYVQYSKNTSNYHQKEPVRNPRNKEVTDKVREKLIMNREMERLSSYLDSKLSESGWKIDIRNILRDITEGRDRRDVTVEELYELVKERAKMLVPRNIQKEMLCKIEKSYHVDVDDGGASGGK